MKQISIEIFVMKKKIKNGASASFVAKLGPVSLPQRAHFQLIGLENFYWEGYIQLLDRRNSWKS